MQYTCAYIHMTHTTHFQYVSVQLPFIPEEDSTSLCVKAGSGTEHWLHAMKWRTHKECVRQDFCILAAPDCALRLERLLGHGSQSYLHPNPTSSGKWPTMGNPPPWCSTILLQEFPPSTASDQGLPMVTKNWSESLPSFENVALIETCQS